VNENLNCKIDDNLVLIHQKPTEISIKKNIEELNEKLEKQSIRRIDEYINEFESRQKIHENYDQDLLNNIEKKFQVSVNQAIDSFYSQIIKTPSIEEIKAIDNKIVNIESSFNQNVCLMKELINNFESKYNELDVE